ncbi:unnamed protein product [Rotaria sp. Silwood2]|nr:unnamed protein product [Rotaria sp. Silwood2]CAF3137436.1 unnamed protein product [Rotaria sp. Silwood2]CAF3383951.1 unnamed protein product [Rotaria sp. Silwood2]CAF4353438.1 unnamed protein product [Rotaria sp. Silwood2]CAF4370677.1 unnamed protein product [Rotaria sp. Silwood2]
MVTCEKRLQSRFSATTSRYLLPTFRRPCYLAIWKDINDQYIDAGNLFYQWTLEGESPIYEEINDALLCDNYNKLRKHIIYINKLRRAIQENRQTEPMRIYRNLELDPAYVRKEYQEDQIFLWPTFSSASRDRKRASKFGNYTFQIDTSSNGVTYYTDISKYSEFPHEQEVLFYPYSGFRVKEILSDAKIIKLECVDTLAVELHSKQLIPEQVKLFDQRRQMFVYLHKDSKYVHWSKADQPDKIYCIGENPTGYWDSPKRFHHRNGYFLNRGYSGWKEYLNNHYHATFQQKE